MSQGNRLSSDGAEAAVTEVSKIVSRLSGIQLGAKQAEMVKNRLTGRLSKLNLQTFDAYLEYLRANMDSESQALLSLLTTHHTFFFREFPHFEFLLNHLLPRQIEMARARGDRKITLWSAASSRGQEAYSLAMFMDFHLKALAPDVDFEVWGTDVDPESVKWAKNGVYKSEELKQAPAMYVADHWVRGKGNVADFSKLKDHLKKKCHFQPANLLACQDFLANRQFDIVFCRNVFIYFDANQIKQCTQKLLEHIRPDGALILGVSESLNGLGLPLQLVGPSVYCHPQKANQKPIAVPSKVVETTKRVLCVDDSPAILALLKKILVKDSGFEVVATAANGLQALEVLKTTKVDVITLDLHMPEMDGLGFLGAYKDKEVPVVIVSAINRDDPSIAQKALALGASDYVEKPSLENIGQASNEIRSKLRTVMTLKKGNPAVATATTKTQGKKKVLIVDDSPTIRQLLEKIISADPELEVIGKAERPSEVEDLIRKHKPDVITLDIHMPEMDGITLLKKIHPRYKIPTVMITSVSREEGPQVLQALEIGAIDYIQKPEMNSLNQAAPLIRERLKAAAQSRVLGRPMVTRKAKDFSPESNRGLILLGASTGGTEALRVVLEGLPKKIPPILIVQHIPAGFSTAFARRLNDLLPFEVKEAAHGDEIAPNRVLIAPGGLQMGLQAARDKLIIQITDGPLVNRHKPSVDHMFRSAGKLGLKSVVAVVMTGMGSDGAQGLKELRQLGVRTIAQDKETSVVYGMPRAAHENGGAEMVVPLQQIAERVVELINTSSSKRKAS